MALVTLTDLRFDYGREKILDRVSVAIQPGVKYALVGANGCVKVTCEKSWMEWMPGLW